MRAVWLLLGLSLTGASFYVWWYAAAEKAANSPPTFVNLVKLAGSLCSIAAGLALGQAVRTIKRVTVRTLIVVVLAVVFAIAFATFRARRSSCVSDEQGLRGEAKRSQDGKLVYFNGECWTHEPVAATDTPF